MIYKINSKIWLIYYINYYLGIDGFADTCYNKLMKIKDFESLGLSTKEASVYISLLEIGNGTALDVSEKALLPKSTVHDVLKDLRNMGLVSSYRKKNKIIFSAGDPSLLVSRVESQRQTLERLLPELNLFYGEKKHKPRVRLYESKQGIEVATREMVLETKEIMLISPLVSTYSTFPEFFPEAGKQRVRHAIRARVLATQQSGVESIVEKDLEMLRETRFLPKNLSIKASVWIWSGKAIFHDISGNPSVLFIEDENIVGLLMTLFELLWKQSENN